MKSRNYVSPLTDWPKTKLIPAQAAIRVRGFYTPPLLAAWLPLLMGIVWVLLVARSYPPEGSTAWEYLYAYIAPAVPVMAVVPLLRLLTLSWVNVSFDPDAVRIGLQNYARSVGIKFQREDHDKAHEEWRREQTTGRKQSMIYRDAVQVVMWYGQRRVVIASFPKANIKHADALVMKLQFVNENLESLLTEALVSE